MRRGIWISAFFTFFFLCAALASLISIERYPPIGWETRVTPGFDPPIEYYIVYQNEGWGTPVNRGDIIKGWGPKAFEALQKLADDPAWRPYKPQIMGLLQQVDSPERVKYFATEVARLLAEPESDQNNADLGTAIGRLASVDYVGYTKVLDENLDKAAARRKGTLALPLFWALNGDHSTDAEQRLIEYAKTGPEPVKKQVQEAINANNAKKRAQEPMQKILDAEKAKGPQQ